MPWPRIAAALLLVIAPSLPLEAQLDGSFDAGGARLRQIGLPRTDVLSLGARLRWQGYRGTFLSSGSTANTPDGSWTAQGVLSASLLASPMQPRRWEVGATVSGFGATGTQATSTSQLLLREHFALGPRAGLFGGVQGGGIVRQGAWRHAASLQAGAWARTRTSTFSGALTLTDTKTELLLEVPPENPGAPFGIYREQHPTTYLDALGFWEFGRDRLELELGGGVRANTRGPSASTLWGSASATFWVLPRLAVVASTGRALEDVVRGLPQTRYAALSLRVNLAGRTRTSLRRPTIDDGAPRLAVARTADSVEISVRVRDAELVELMGDFTGWEPTALARSGDAWVLRRAIGAGSHRVALRIDGGEWLAPANLPKVSNDFGGMVGLVSVP